MNQNSERMVGNNQLTKINKMEQVQKDIQKIHKYAN